MVKTKTANKNTLLCWGEAILLSSISFAVASVEMSSKFSVKNFSTNQETLQNAADALSDYITIALVWTIATVLILYAKYGLCGIISGFVMNFIILFWIYNSYKKSFKVAADKNKLEMPTINFFGF
jgi:small-conductance mechanosensitive channel